MAEQLPELLRAAVENGDLNMLDNLLKNGTGINRMENSNLIDDHKLLHIAVKKMQVEVVKLLINYRVKINLKDSAGKPPVLYAIENGNTEIAELLIINGAKIKANSRVLFPVDLQRNKKVFGNAFKDRSSIKKVKCAYWYKGLTPLHIAVDKMFVDMAKLLIDHGVNVNGTDFRGLTPIVTAIENGHVKMTEMLLNNGAVIKEDSSILCAALKTGNLKILKILLNGADIGMIERPLQLVGLSPLHVAADRMQLEVAKLLISYGVNVNQKDYMHRTPLIYAVQNSHVEMMDLLLINGAYILEKPHVLISISKYIWQLKMQLVEAQVTGNFINSTHLHMLINKTFTNSPPCMVLKYHIIKLKAAGIYIEESIMQWIRRYDDTGDLLQQCEEEFEIIKTKKIGNSSAFFYDIFRPNLFELAKDESIVQTMKSGEYKKMFPIYSSMIESTFIRGFERVELLKQVRNKCVQSLFKSSPEFPLHCADKIFSHLSEVDLRVLLAACL